MALTDTQIQAQVTFWDGEVTRIQAQLIALREQTINGATTVQSYSTNDGQASQSVTKKDSAKLSQELRAAISELAFYQSLLSTSGGVRLVGGMGT